MVEVFALSTSIQMHYWIQLSDLLKLLNLTKCQVYPIRYLTIQRLTKEMCFKAKLVFKTHLKQRPLSDVSRVSNNGSLKVREEHSECPNKQ